MSRKEATFQVRCTDEELAAWRGLASSRGYALAAFVRALLAKELGGNGLSAGDQPGTGTGQGQSVVDPSGGGSASPTVGATGARPAPAESPFQPDWKKGKK